LKQYWLTLGLLVPVKQLIRNFLLNFQAFWPSEKFSIDINRKKQTNFYVFFQFINKSSYLLATVYFLLLMKNILKLIIEAFFFFYINCFQAHRQIKIKTLIAVKSIHSLLCSESNITLSNNQSRYNINNKYCIYLCT